MQWFSAAEVARIKKVAKATIAGHIADGTLEAVNIARRGSVRARWRISQAMIDAFDERQCNKPSPTVAETKSSRRTIQRPTKDYFANVGGGQ